MMLAIRTATLTSAAVLFTVFTAQAQAQTQADANDSTPSIALEMVVVTAEHRSESMQKVPIAITAFSNTDLQQRGADNLLDVAAAVPNMQFSGGTYAGRPEITLRGIYTNVRNNGFNAGIGVYVDGVYMGRPALFDPDLSDVARIEVLNGPQGTLFGKNTVAGAISVISQKPGDQSLVKGEVSYGNFGTWRAKVSAEGALVEDKLFAKATYLHVSSDGYVKNLFNNSKMGNEHTNGGKVQFRYLPTENLELNLSADYTASRYLLGTTEALTGGLLLLAPGPYTVNQNVQSGEHLKRGGIDLTANYTFGDGHVLTSISAYRGFKDWLLYDQDNSPADAATSDFTDRQRQFSQEIRLASPSSGRFKYVIGAYYLHESVRGDHFTLFGVNFPAPNTSLGSFTKVVTDSYAVFAQLNYDITEDLSAFGGLRYTNEKHKLDLRQTGNALLGFPDIAPTRQSRSDDAFTPTIGLQYQANPNLMFYVKYARGFQSGGFNADFIASAPQIPFAPEYVNNYEAGMKSEFWNGRMRFNLAVFEMKLSNMQVSQFQAPGFKITNAGKATTRGFEASLTAQLTEELEVDGAVGYDEAKFDRFVNGGGPGIDYTGNKLAHAPPWTFNISALYQKPIANVGTFMTRVDYNFRSSQFGTEKNDPVFDRVPGYGQMNGRVGLTLEGTNLSVYFWGKNILDKHALAVSARDALLGVRSGRYIEPRTYGITLDAQF